MDWYGPLSPDKTVLRMKYYFITKNSTFKASKSGPSKEIEKNLFENCKTGVRYDVDKSHLEETLQIADKDKTYWNNKSKEEIFHNLKEDAKKRRLKDYDGVCLMFLTFLGDKDDTIILGNGTKEDSVPISDIVDALKNIEDLHGKPKIILIQADDTSMLPKEDSAFLGRGPIVQETGYEIQKIPSDADRLIIKCTIPQKWAEEHQDWPIENVLEHIRPRTSFFIRAFCDALNENMGKKDLVSMTTSMNRKVQKMIQETKDNVKGQTKNQATLDKMHYPCCSSTFRKNFRFP